MGTQGFGVASFEADKRGAAGAAQRGLSTDRYTDLCTSMWWSDAVLQSQPYAGISSASAVFARTLVCSNAVFIRH